MMALITAAQLRDFASAAIEHFRSGVEVEPSMWLLLQDGQTIVVPGTDFEHYDDHSEWPMLLMTGPDPEWFVTWWLEDFSLGGDEREAAMVVAREKAATATDADWLALCQRVIDVQFTPVFGDPTEGIEP